MEFEKAAKLRDQIEAVKSVVEKQQVVSLAVRTTPVVYWVELEMNNIPAFIEEPFQPPADTLKWRVNFYYNSRSKVEDYWKDAGKSWNKRIENFMGHKNGVEEAVSKTVAATDTPEQKVRKIYAYVSQLENQSYIPYRAQQEEHVTGHETQPGGGSCPGAAQRRPRRFGPLVCRHGAGCWDSRLADVGAQSQRRLFRRTLHEYRATGSRDCHRATGWQGSISRSGNQVLSLRNHQLALSGLRGVRQSPEKGTEFGGTPAPEYKQAMTVRVAHVALNDQGAIDGTVDLAFYGIEAMNWRREAGRTDPEGRKKLLEDEIKRWLPGNSEITLTKIPQWDDAEQPVVAEFKISSPVAVSAGKRWLVTPHIFQINDKPAFPAAQRVNPIYFDYPSQEIGEVHLALPPNAEIESLPPDDSAKLDYALYKTQQKQEAANTVFSRRDLIIGGILFPVTEYKAIKDFYDKVKAGVDEQVILKAAPHAAGN